MNLDRVMMYVSSTADQGVVGPGTRFGLWRKAQRSGVDTAALRSRGTASWARSRDHNSFFGMRKSRHPVRYTGVVPFVR